MEIQSHPTVSVIIPTYNRAHLVAESIQSVLDQTFTDFELIVVDDGSTDNTKDVVNSFQDPRIRYIYQEDRGVAAARNTGIKASSGEHIALLDSDDIWLPQNLELKVKLLDSCPDVALVCSDSYFFDNRTGTIRGRYWHEFTPYFNLQKASEQPLIHLLSRGCFIAPQATLMRRLVFNEVGYLDESLRTHDDLDIFIRIVQRFSIKVIDMPLVKIRLHGANLSSNWDMMYSEDVAVLDKAIKNYSLSKTELKIARRRIAHGLFKQGYMIMDDRIDAGREKLLASIKVNPWRIRPYIYLVLSLLGSGGVLIVKSWKKRLNGLLVQHQASGNSQSREGILKT